MLIGFSDDKLYANKVSNQINGRNLNINQRCEAYFAFLIPPDFTQVTFERALILNPLPSLSPYLFIQNQHTK